MWCMCCDIWRSFFAAFYVVIQLSHTFFVYRYVLTLYINNKVKVKDLRICFSGCCRLTIGFRDSLASSASSSSSASLALLNSLLVWWTSTWWSLMTSIGGWLCWQPPLCLLCLWKVCESVVSLELLGLELLCCCLACVGNSIWAAGGNLLILQYNMEVTFRHVAFRKGLFWMKSHMPSELDKRYMIQIMQIELQVAKCWNLQFVLFLFHENSL